MLQPKLNLKVSQRQVLTPGLVQMVSVLALNKLELKEMINTEVVENPVLEEVEQSSATLEELSAREGERERAAEDTVATERTEKDPFEEIDFGSYFQEYLDPGFRSPSTFEELDRPSFDNFLSQPSTLTDHLMWQLGSMTLSEQVSLGAELVIGNLNEDGYLTESDDELADELLQIRPPHLPEPIPFERGMRRSPFPPVDLEHGTFDAGAAVASVEEKAGSPTVSPHERAQALAAIVEARETVCQLDPIGVGARDLRECLLLQIAAQHREAELVARRKVEWERTHEQDSADADAQSVVEGSTSQSSQNGARSNAAQGFPDTFEIATLIVTSHLPLLQKKDMRELTRHCGRTPEEVQAAVDYIRTLDPRPGRRYNLAETRLIEPDVAFAKRDGQYVVLMNEEEMPTLRLSRAYRRLLREKDTEKDVREYVKERYKSAIQLLRNIEQRKNTIIRTCEVIVRRQTEFLERGEQGLKPMMIKEVAEEIGVHPSTVSRAVANKYVHTSQGVYELRYFFTEAVNGPEGGDLPLVLLKRKVKKLIEEEDPRKPFTDDQLAAELQRQGIQVTRRTVAKYREDMQIPSTHQRRVR